jgi:hypothetical protein
VVLIKKELLMSRAGMDIERAADAEARCFAALSFSHISLFEKERRLCGGTRETKSSTPNKSTHN